MKVLKFGGTSLASGQRMRKVADIAAKESPVLVVLSAVAGTTDALADIVEAAKGKQTDRAGEIISRLKTSYQDYLEGLFLSEQFKHKGRELIVEQLQQIDDLVSKNFSSEAAFLVLATGEMISTGLFHLLNLEMNRLSCLISSLDFLRLTRDNAPDEVFLKEQLSEKISALDPQSLIITQGFICRDINGAVRNLKRGGSDYSASLFAAAIGSEELQIWTDIDGMHNNDPRFIDNTKPVRELSFDEAAELAYFGAKILHPSSIKPARRNNIPVKLLNTLEPSAHGTLISSVTTRGSIKAVAGKNGITAIKIRSSEMLQAPGFLRRIFEVFELYKTSIDMVTTSEVAVSVTIDDTRNLQAITETLIELGHVEIDKDLSIICVVGEFLIENSSLASQVVNLLKDIPIRMISYGGSAHNISLLISEELKVDALQALHRGLFLDST